ncbi:ribosome silencing factor [Salinisphaera sp.]|uniref:ribosome silencing factor n=1 Tax=Salinisphaera sp. TaxID=1914330 RepID=UPI000C5EE050|nr:ribosome silencing factor [Salinisphaera sp.]MBS62278.1 ribosome silencing factor [Salinisphaera sp.]
MNLQNKPETARNSDPKINALLELAIEAVDELKGESVQVLDVADLTTIADHMVICSGRSARHVKRLGETVIAHAKDAGIQPRVEGLSQAEWVLIDLNGVVVHIMQPVTRAYYQLEKLWDMDAIAAESSTTH